MRRLVACIGLVLLLFAMPAAAAPTKAGPKDKQSPKEKLASTGSVTGKVVSVEGSQKTFTVDVIYKVQVPNQGAVQNINNLLVQRAQVASNPNLGAQDRLNQLRNIAIEIEKNKVNLYSTEDKHQKIDLQAADEVKVRVANPPVEFDDKGKPKKYTAKELKELKGPGNLWGYPGELENLKPDQYVEVFIPKKKTTTRPTTKPKEADAPPEDRLTVVEIHVLGETKK